jgi:hypothetical protein
MIGQNLDEKGIKSEGMKKQREAKRMATITDAVAVMPIPVEAFHSVE